MLQALIRLSPKIFEENYYFQNRSCYIHGVLLEPSYSVTWREPSGALPSNEQNWKHRAPPPTGRSDGGFATETHSLL